MNESTAPAPVLIVGGGMTGLAAAWELQQQNVPYVLFEASGLLGGKVETTLTDEGFLIEKAADAFILGKPYAAQLAREVGLEAEAIHPREDTKKLYFLRGGRLLDFPGHLKMFVPLDDEAFRASGVLSPGGTERFLNEVNVPPKPPTAEDESLASFVIRRFGEEALNFIVPIAAGIYVANPYELSMQAAFPQFLKMEQDYGSLITGSRATPRASGPIFMSFREGMGALPAAIAAKLTGEVRLNTPVLRVHPDGVTLAGGEKVAGSGVILALPAWYAAPMLSQGFPETAQLVGELRANSSVAVTLAYRREDIEFDMNMHGLLVDASEGIPLKAMTVHSAKLHGRAPEGHVLVRCFFVGLEPMAAYREAVKEVGRLLGAKEAPLDHWYGDWRGKNPAYQVGHLEQLARIRQSLPPNVKIGGASFTGVGIPDCVNAGRTMAREVMILRAAEA
ncbi:protoporphyrinogen oxidase [Deinococcus fonticola]|uniref:protoporphyrinogen oxidase n=1 Tax=Deinococcus fonticola TaxID=2528713 RepID=UPI001F0FAD1C|nr:protoporphyrinogen oxidase [Deinococcus fonticola]